MPSSPNSPSSEAGVVTTHSAPRRVAYFPHDQEERAEEEREEEEREEERETLAVRREKQESDVHRMSRDEVEETIRRTEDKEVLEELMEVSEI